MGIRFNNSFFKLSAGSFTSNQPLFIPPPPPIGNLFRIVNISDTNSGTFFYTDLEGQFTAIGLNPGQIAYFQSSFGYDDSLQALSSIGGADAVITWLLISSSVYEPTVTFTEQVITTTGAGSWTKPAGVTQVIVECLGGGGAGGGVTAIECAGGGGAGGTYARSLINYTSPSISIPYSVAASVAGTTSNGSVGNNTTWNTNVVLASGGNGGEAGTIAQNPGNGGTGTTSTPIGQILYGGGDGFNGAYSLRATLASGGGGGGGAGTYKIGNNAGASVSNIGGDLSEEFGGTGGSGTELASSGINGSPGTNYSAGGSGGTKMSGANRSGGAGAQGLIRLIYR